MRWLLFILLLVPGYHNVLVAQCDSKDVLFKRIATFQHSGSQDVKIKLPGLLKFDTITRDCGYTNDSSYVDLLTDISILYFYQSDFDLAIQYVNKALEIVSNNPDTPAVSKKRAIILYYYKTIYYDSLKIISKKNEAVDSCMASEKRLGTDYQYTCILLAFRVADLFYKGDYSLCAEYATMGELLMREYYHKSDSMNFISFFIEKKIIALAALKKFREAEDYLDSKRDFFSKTNNNVYLGIYNYLQAQIYTAKEENEKAIEYLKKGFQYDSKTARKNISGEMLCQVGIIYNEKLGQPETALQYYYRALVYARRVDALIIYGKIARIYAGKEKFDSAWHFFQKAFDMIKPGISEQDLLVHTTEYVNTGSSEYIMNIVLAKADTYMLQFNAEGKKTPINEALRIYKTADRLLNIMKDEQIAFESKLAWRNYSRQLYEHAIEASHLVNRMDDAFYFFEKSRAVLLNDELNEQKWLSNEELIKLAQLKKSKRRLETELSGTQTVPEREKEIKQQQFAISREMIHLEQSIKQHNPLYFRSVLDTGFAGIREMQKRLFVNGQSLIEIYAGDSAIYVFVITPELAKLVKVQKPDYDILVGRFIRFTSDPRLLNSGFTAFSKTAGQLYQLLFKDCNVPAGRIIISPDGPYFAFESLITSNPGEPVRYFLQDHAVSYTYSARFLENDLNVNSKNSTKNFMGVAPVNYPASFSLASLAGSEQSLNNIAGNFSGVFNYVSGNASRTNFMQHFSQYTILQLYTHAAEISKNNEPVIYFADSLLYLSDLIGVTRPLTKLVVLSACETGLGKEYKGEGVFSFNRGFAALGIPSSVTNLWTVDNESTYKITELFYKYIAEDLPLDESLQKAKLDFIKTSSKEKQLPYYWAAAVLIGNSDAIIIEKNRNWPLYIITIGVPVLFFILFLGIRKRN